MITSHRCEGEQVVAGECGGLTVRTLQDGGIEEVEEEIRTRSYLWELKEIPHLLDYPREFAIAYALSCDCHVTCMCIYRVWLDICSAGSSGGHTCGCGVSFVLKTLRT